MKVLHLWKRDGGQGRNGGAGGAQAMSRLHTGLKAAGVESRILCEIKTSASPDVIRLDPPPRIERRLQRITSKFGLNDIHRISSFWLNQHPAYQAADIINIHGTHHGFINYLALPRLTREKPTVFCMHDMWALTGHCAVAVGCEQWKHGCTDCHHLEVVPGIRRNSAWLEWKLKKWVYQRSKMTIVCPSKELTEQAKEGLLSRFPIVHIPHGIDTNVYHPLDLRDCRSTLGIPPEKKVLMFGAVNLDIWNKGGDLLIRALQYLPKALKQELLLLTMGTGGEVIANATDIPVEKLGYIESDKLRALAYSAADLFVSPTRGEAFGLTVLESIACGTPVVAFGVGGILDLVRPGITGYRAQPGDPEDLANGIIQLLADEERLRVMGKEGPRVVQREYTIDLQVQRYIDLYNQLLNSD